MKNAKKLLALLLALALCVGMLSACGNKDPKPTETGAQPSGSVAPTDATYTYKGSVSTMCTNWNPHTYQTNDDAYLADYIRVGLYGFVFNDELHPVEGKEAFSGYKIIPEMAASEPVDVTEKVKAEHPEFNIPADATAGYAYTIDLNPNACWEDGTPINADTYVYSMQKLLDPKLLNYRASDYYSQNFCIAGAEAYANGGHEALTDNGVGAGYTMADLTKGEDGQYVGPNGEKMYIGLDYALDWTSGDTLKDLVDNYGENYFDVTNWETLVGMVDDRGLIPLTDENLALFVTVIAGNPAWGETEENAPGYFVYGVDMPEVPYDGTVGLYKTGDYQITLVLAKSLAGFNLLYSLSSNWIVKEDLYEANLKETNGVWSSTYNTSVDTTSSYGPYKLVTYQTDKFLRVEKNEKWYGWSDGQHNYVDPADGQTYQMYQTTAIECSVVAEASTNKLMFLKGELMTYGLQAEDFDSYRNSEYVHFTPGTTIFFLILNGHKDAIKNREAAADFDQTTTDLETMTLLSFRKAMGVSFDKELFAATISPARSGAYGIIGTAYVYDPDTGARYRDTDQAKKALCDFYSVDVSKYDSLDDAVDSITGYDPEAAKELFTEAFQEALEAGYITDNNGDGVSDQTVTIEYCLSSDSDFMTKTINYLNEKINEATAGTPFAGKIQFIKSAPYGNDWSNKIKAGLADTVLGGWTGSALDPFSLSDLYVNPSYAYDAQWFDATTVTMTRTINGEEITLNLKQWSDALNGTTVEVGGKSYNWGNGIADVDTRLDILAGLETTVLGTYDYLPMLQDASAALLTQQAYYVIDDYNPVMSRGGIQYLKYNYNDADWAAYVKGQGGELKY